ncbi:hypothetical protein WN51_08662 [Melipona quadrifasciata]|uniref:Uncharacterized protein n=1 Tax=Melipona quadrifasciata TaxID=166423 RepID=A0A0M9A9V2_9HYME|nr:hypothetical protein WN51_08662 [Melipona quadrifasciata]
MAAERGREDPAPGNDESFRGIKREPTKSTNWPAAVLNDHFDRSDGPSSSLTFLCRYLCVVLTRVSSLGDVISIEQVNYRDNGGKAGDHCRMGKDAFGGTQEQRTQLTAE